VKPDATVDENFWLRGTPPSLDRAFRRNVLVPHVEGTVVEDPRDQRALRNAPAFIRAPDDVTALPVVEQRAAPDIAGS